MPRAADRASRTSAPDNRSAAHTQLSTPLASPGPANRLYHARLADHAMAFLQIHRSLTALTASATFKRSKRWEGARRCVAHALQRWGF
jgi:hypothetical protein